MYCVFRTYRPGGSTNLVRVTGQRLDGCVACPRGRYGSTAGLTLSSCSGPCPIGTYGDETGLVSVAGCKPCPLGKYSAAAGIISESQCVACPAGRYSDVAALTNAGQCKICPFGYGMYQCVHPVLTRAKGA